MKTRLATLLLTLALTAPHAQLRAQNAADAAAKPGYNVVVELLINEQGEVEESKIASSEDFSGDKTLDQIALSLGAKVKLPPREKDGKKVKYRVRAPFHFPVEDDEGPAANNAPQPSIRNATKPAYPANLVEQGAVGGAILELNIGADGKVASVRVMRASHPEFGAAAAAAVQEWEFAPAMREGQAVACRWRLAIGFSLDGRDVGVDWKIAPRPSLGAYTVVKMRTPPAAPAAETPAKN